MAAEHSLVSSSSCPGGFGLSRDGRGRDTGTGFAARHRRCSVIQAPLPGVRGQRRPISEGFSEKGALILQRHPPHLWGARNAVRVFAQSVFTPKRRGCDVRCHWWPSSPPRSMWVPSVWVAVLRPLREELCRSPSTMSLRHAAGGARCPSIVLAATRAAAISSSRCPAGMVNGPPWETRAGSCVVRLFEGVLDRRGCEAAAPCSFV